MKRVLLTLITAIFMISTLAYAIHRHTREQLETLSKEDLIDLVMDLEDRLDQRHPRRDCQTYNPLNDETGSLLIRYNNRGYNNDGTLKWPNGNIFMRRNRDYDNDRTLYYPGEQVFHLKNQSYDNDGTVKWPNGQVLFRRNAGYDNDGSVYHSDGSIWLRRNRGYDNDRQRYGLPIERFTFDNLQTTARLTSDDGVLVRFTLPGDGWDIEISLLTEESGDNYDYSVTVTECFEE